VTSYVDDKSTACHVKSLSAESIPFFKGESIIMVWVKVGVLHMRKVHVYTTYLLPVCSVNHVRWDFFQLVHKY
jgi:hypothetical protein